MTTQGARPEVPKSPPSYPVEAVDRTLQVLSLLSRQPSISVTEVAEEINATASTAHRLLAMFVYRDFLRQDPGTKRYETGPALFVLGLGVLGEMSILQRARPLLAQLVAETQETAHLLILGGATVTFLEGIESPHAVRAGLRTGATLPAHATAAGKALLARLPPERLAQLYPQTGLESLTPTTLRSFDQLERELETVRAQGYATNDEESEPNLRAIAIALPDNTGISPIGISLAAPAFRLEGQTREKAIVALLNVARQAAKLSG